MDQQIWHRFFIFVLTNSRFSETRNMTKLVICRGSASSLLMRQASVPRVRNCTKVRLASTMTILTFFFVSHLRRIKTSNFNGPSTPYQRNCKSGWNPWDLGIQFCLIPMDHINWFLNNKPPRTASLISLQVPARSSPEMFCQGYLELRPKRTCWQEHHKGMVLYLSSKKTTTSCGQYDVWKLLKWRKIGSNNHSPSGCSSANFPTGLTLTYWLKIKF